MTDSDARPSGEEQQQEQPEDTETTMSESTTETDSTDELPSPEDAPSVCTEFTLDHPLDDDDEADFAFICPRCEKANALVGSPLEFLNKPFRCLACNYVPLLEKEALEEFAEETADD